MKLFALVTALILASSIISTFVFSENYNYYCVDGVSYENISSATTTITDSKVCQFGCDNSTDLTYHQGATPQADLCNPDPFIIDIWIIAGMFGFVIFISFVLWMVNRI